MSHKIRFDTLRSMMVSSGHQSKEAKTLKNSMWVGGVNFEVQWYQAAPIKKGRKFNWFHIGPWCGFEPVVPRPYCDVEIIPWFLKNKEKEENGGNFLSKVDKVRIPYPYVSSVRVRVSYQIWLEFFFFLKFFFWALSSGNGYINCWK